MPHEVSMPEEEKIEGFPKWEVEGWLRSLQQANEVAGDPEKMKAVEALGEEIKGSIKSIDDLRRARDKMSQES